ncbi:MAG: hypothetical protein LBG70_00880, partial [Bifidobacteriaceae bacterium]|nr:hypothetical protein [Bifidobacteriaceae bacterium]
MHFLKPFVRYSAMVAGAALAIGVLQPVGAFATTQGPPPDQLLPLTQYVNLLIGTSMPASSGYAGNVAPGAQVPFGMVNFGPDMPRSNYNGSGGSLVSGTTPRINFFSLTHLNGPGCPGGGVVGMMPTINATSNTNASGNPVGVTYTATNEQSGPGRYAVTLSNGVAVELTSTARTGMARFTYPNKDQGYYSI